MTDLLTLVNPECPGCQALLVLVQQQAKQIAELTARVEELERRLAQDSTPTFRTPEQLPEYFER